TTTAPDVATAVAAPAPIASVADATRPAAAPDPADSGEEGDNDGDDRVWPDVRSSRLCRTLCEEAGLYGMWNDNGPTPLVIRLLQQNGGPLSADQIVRTSQLW